ncbi:unnamed protein product [Blepharisma stoltei]|uniref:Uncharacterized protein n=1 Tax=Blepharisma stoltei TaxID=1481888 RepID=A0AAU9IZY3_9CILI|nr:unnamed protein product [Blepharisma stoltei]
MIRKNDVNGDLSYIMKTRQNSLHPTYISTRKFEIKASHAEVIGDLEQIIGSVPNISSAKKNKSQPFSPAEFPKRQKLKRAVKNNSSDPIIPEAAIGILGFASFLIEAETQSQIPIVAKQPKKTQKPVVKQPKKQNNTAKPEIKAQVSCMKPEIKTQISFMSRNFGMYMNYPSVAVFPQAFKFMPLTARELPRAANHLKIAFWINKHAKAEKQKSAAAEC